MPKEFVHYTINQEFAQYIECIRNLSPSQEWVAVDHECRIIAASNGFIYSLGEPDIIGKKLDEVNQYAEEVVNGFKKVFNLIISRVDKSNFKFIRVKTIGEHVVLGDLRVSKITDSITGGIIGAIGLLNQIKFAPSVINFVKNIKMDGIVEIKDYDDKLQQLELDEQPHIVCWLIVLHKSIQEIADILEKIYHKPFARSTVSGLIQRHILEKVDANISVELFDKIHSLGILNSIPERLFNHLTTT